MSQNWDAWENREWVRLFLWEETGAEKGRSKGYNKDGQKWEKILTYANVLRVLSEGPFRAAGT